MHVTTIQGEKTGSIDKKKVRSCKAPNNDKKFGKKQKNYDSEIKDIELLGQPHLTRVVLVLKKKIRGLTLNSNLRSSGNEAMEY